ncbi:hypothetical protein BDW62DRAFT_202736 [Aspergillus aurantiobrunneus]
MVRHYFSLVTLGTLSNVVDRQWWLPVVGMYAFPAILTTGWLFFPESPYWLVRQEKHTQARKSLRRVYGIKNDTLYHVEVQRMELENLHAISIQGGRTETRRICLWLDLSSEAECFHRMNRKRTLTAIFAASGQQLMGATFVIGYATYFLDLIGVEDYFDASIVLYAVMLLASMLSFPLTEIIGRRTMSVVPQIGLCCMLLLIGILGCVPTQENGSWGIVVFIYIWAIIYQLFTGAVGFVLASEIATVLRFRICPDAGNLGAKVGFIFLATGLVAAIGGWYLYPETKGVSFEAMDELYASGTAPRHFRPVSEQRGYALQGTPPMSVV